MAVTMHQIKRWYNMLAGKSVWHVNQDLGKHFKKSEISGYYNNMKEKVTKMLELLEDDKLPRLNIEGNRWVYFPVAIFQYGLGAWDLYIETKEDIYVKKFMQCANWAIEHQDEQGRWNNFFYIFPDTPYGAMAQGEATSLLIRAYKYTNDDIYLNAAKRAIDYMLQPMTKGGVTEYNADDVIFREYTNQPTVMNGWIFAWWGLYDYILVSKNTEYYKDILEKSLNSLINYLPRFKCSYWSIYSLDGKMASPFYHNLHIAQMQAMYELTGKNIFKEYAEEWTKQQKNPINKCVAFVKKAWQKIIE